MVTRLEEGEKEEKQCSRMWKGSIKRRTQREREREGIRWKSLAERVGTGKGKKDIKRVQEGMWWRRTTVIGGRWEGRGEIIDDGDGIV